VNVAIKPLPTINCRQSIESTLADFFVKEQSRRNRRVSRVKCGKC
jgi:hypothetical protein